MPELGVKGDRAATMLRLVCLGDYILAAATVLPEQLRLLHLLLSDPRGIIPDTEAYRAEDATIALFMEVHALFSAAADAGTLDAGVAATRTIVWLASMQQIVQTGKLARFDAELFDTTTLARRDRACVALRMGQRSGAPRSLPALGRRHRRHHAHG